MFDYSSFNLLVDLELFKFAVFRSCSVRRRFEETNSKYEVYLVLRDVHVSKSA